MKDLRESVGLTQAELAGLAGTSQPAIAAYEAGSKSPTLRTLSRLAGAVGREVDISFVLAMTREDRRSLLIHQAIAVRLLTSPADVLSKARRNLQRMRDRHPEARPLFDQWGRILEGPVGQIVAVMSDSSVYARDLRQVTPFAGVLTPAERADVYRRFRHREGSR